MTKDSKVVAHGHDALVFQSTKPSIVGSYCTIYPLAYFHQHRFTKRKKSSLPPCFDLYECRAEGPCGTGYIF